MNTYKIEGSATRPSVKFDLRHGVLEISGRSIEENSVEFYKPLSAEIEKYALTPAPATRIDIKLDYINTASARCLVDVLKELEGLHKKGLNVVINWYYEEGDEEMMETGEDFLNFIHIPFNLCPLKAE